MYTPSIKSIQAIFAIAFSLNAVVAQDTLFIDTVAVKSGRSGGLSGRLVQRIDSRNLDALPVHSADDYLDYIPWIDLRSRGIQGVQGDLSIRGAGYEQTLIMMDGVPISDPQTGHHNLNLPIPVEMIAGMEIIASGASRIFGPKAMAGSVNFTLKSPVNNRVWASAFGGNYSMYRLAAGFSKFKKGFGIGVSGQTSASDGYMKNTDFNHSMLLLQAIKMTRRGKIWLNLSGGGKRFGAQNFYSAQFPLQHEYLKTGIATFNWEHSTANYQITANTFLRYNQDRFELFREGKDWFSKVGSRYVNGNDTTPVWYTGHNYHRSTQYGSMLNLSRKLGIQTISIGGEFRVEEIKSNVLGEKLNTPIKVPFGDSNSYFSRGAARQNASVFLEDKIIMSNWIISAGILLNNNSVFGTDIYPGLDVSYLASSKMKLFATINAANRFPTYTDLYYNRGGAVGSKDLKPEEAISGELGSEYRAKRMYARLSAFMRNSNNLIDWIRLPGSTITSATNLTKILYYGADAQFNYKPKGKLNNVISELGLSLFSMGANNNSNGFESNYALDFINQKLAMNIELKLRKNLRIGFVGYHQKRRGGYIPPGSTQEIPFKAVQSADLRVSVLMKKLSLHMEARNILNAKVMDIGNVTLPGRWLSAGIKIDIQK